MYLYIFLYFMYIYIYMQLDLRVLGMCSLKAFLSIHRFVELIDHFLSKYLNSRKIYENVFVWFGVSWRHSSYDVVYILNQQLLNLSHNATDIGNAYKSAEILEYFPKKVLLIFSCPTTYIKLSWFTYISLSEPKMKILKTRKQYFHIQEA